ncbi:MAG: hypothetical protein KF838_14470 [Phycisphaeraceae bacterium]|nr:MAG: hypothetical protein KF838_14470 [Phycisphaeraceae bacterium]
MIEVPPAIVRLQDFIERSLTGVPLEVRSGESFDNMLFDYQVGIYRVRIVRDRGEWRVECSFGADEWHDLCLLRQARGHGDDMLALPLEVQVDYAIEHLPTIFYLIGQDHRLIDAMSSAYAERRRRWEDKWNNS